MIVPHIAGGLLGSAPWSLFPTVSDCRHPLRVWLPWMGCFTKVALGAILSREIGANTSFHWRIFPKHPLWLFMHALQLLLQTSHYVAHLRLLYRLCTLQDLVERGVLNLLNGRAQRSGRQEQPSCWNRKHAKLLVAVLYSKLEQVGTLQQ